MSDEYLFSMTNISQCCALCSQPIDLSCCTPDTYETTMATHHAVCPKRPIAVGDLEVGDPVRWQSHAHVDNWVEGMLRAINRESKMCSIEISSEGPRRSTGAPIQSFGFKTSTLRRIPRPAEAQFIAPAPVSPELLAQRDRLVQQSYELPMGIPITRPICAPPATALVDGLDREACLARWMENRLAVEGGAAPPHTLTPAQVAAGRALWLERYGAARSAELRAKVAAGIEAERNLVTYSELDAED